APGYLAEYLLLQVWAPPYRVKNDKKTGEINHTRRSSTAHFVRSTGCKSLFCGFAAQKVSTKKTNLQPAAELNVVR
ncbi:hypothetical protein, partial [Cellvibrio fontiphilus]